MPASTNHCKECLFAALAPADAVTTYLEETYVEAHTLALFDAEAVAPTDISHGKLASDRVIAARGCAKVISEGSCKRFVGFVAHSGNHVAQTFIMERHV